MSSPDNITEKPIEAIKSKSELYMWLQKRQRVDSVPDNSTWMSTFVDHFRDWFHATFEKNARQTGRQTLYEEDLKDISARVAGVIMARAAETHFNGKHINDTNVVFLRDEDSLALWRGLYPHMKVRNKPLGQSNLRIGNPDGVVIRMNHETKEAQICTAYEYTVLSQTRNRGRMNKYYHKKLNQYEKFYNDHNQLFSEDFKIVMAHPFETIDNKNKLKLLDETNVNHPMSQRLERVMVPTITKTIITEEMKILFDLEDGTIWRIPALPDGRQIIQLTIGDLYAMAERAAAVDNETIINEETQSEGRDPFFEEEVDDDNGDE
jgi:hypothetical protein